MTIKVANKQHTDRIYNDELLKGSYVFNFGALYPYKHDTAGEIIAGFWQFS